jgi:MinD-like ATPase involved in chromosome partitioning or flagellar assembly/tetratricopeptide (TPR) repeat protein
MARTSGFATGCRRSVKTVTFYSYKGGAGRTLAVANTAVFAAIGGMKVVALDFDLEAPGLGYKLFGKQPPQGPGLVGYLRDRIAFGTAPDISDYLIERPVRLAETTGGWLKYLPAGRSPSPNYFHDLLSLRLDQRLDDGTALDALIELKLLLTNAGADLLLIDARTGVTASNRVTTHVLADDVVALTLDSEEQLQGTRAVLRSLQPFASLSTDAPIGLHVLVSRVPRDQDTKTWLVTDRDKEIVDRVSSFLVTPAEPISNTVRLEWTGLLHHEPGLVEGEFVCMDSVGPWVDTPLHQDYRRLVEKLFGRDLCDRADAAVSAVTSPLLAALWSGSQEKMVAAHSIERTQGGEPLNERVANLRIAVRRDPSQLPELNSLLRTLVAALDFVGDEVGALEALTEAAQICGVLAEDAPDHYRSNLASSLREIGVRLGMLGRLDEALEATKAAGGQYAILVQSNPERYGPDVAGSLRDLGVRLGMMGRLEEALKATSASVGAFLNLSTPHPERHSPDLAKSLHSLGIVLGMMGKLDEALPVTEAAVSKYRVLVELNPERHSPDLAKSLHSLGIVLGMMGKLDEALPVTEAAVSQFRLLAEMNPERYGDDLAKALHLLAVGLKASG